jgi:hypothetical protein
MRTTSALLLMFAAVLASSACASSVSTMPGSLANHVSEANFDAVPQPAATILRRTDNVPKPRGWFDAKEATGALVYVAGGDEVAIFRQKDAKLVGEITDGVNGAYGLFADAKGGLYVANTSTITAYRPGTIHPWITYDDPDSPLYVVADHSGRVYAANRGGRVTEFPRNQTTPDVTIKTPGIEADGINVDNASNLYVAYRGRQGHGSIEKFAPNSTSGQILGMNVWAPQGLQIDGDGNIIVVETGNGTIDVYPPGKTQPSQVVGVEPFATQVVLGGNQRTIYYSNYADHDVYAGPYPMEGFGVRLVSGLKYSQGMALSHEER